MAAHAYVMFPVSMDILPGATSTFSAGFTGVAGDGVSIPKKITGAFMYDATQTPAVNLVNMKVKVAQTAADFGISGVQTSNILIFTAVN